jgi:hypothetical protein
MVRCPRIADKYWFGTALAFFNARVCDDILHQHVYVASVQHETNRVIRAHFVWNKPIAPFGRLLRLAVAYADGYYTMHGFMAIHLHCLLLCTRRLDDRELKSSRLPVYPSPCSIPSTIHLIDFNHMRKCHCICVGVTATLPCCTISMYYQYPTLYTLLTILHVLYYTY